MENFRYLPGVTTLQLDTEACVGCGMCESVCPHTVFQMKGKKAEIEDLDGCMECGACAQNCPTDAIQAPYQLDANPPTVRSIEGIPSGNLDQYVLSPQDPAWNTTVPKEIPTLHHRTVVSCYSWPGVYPERCMEKYGRQLVPLFEALVGRGGPLGLRSDGGFFERALWRSSLKRWAN